MILDYQLCSENNRVIKKKTKKSRSISFLRRAAISVLLLTGSGTTRRLSLYRYVYIYLFIFIFMYRYIYIFTYIYMYIYIYIYTYMYVYMHVFTYIYMYTYVYIFEYISLIHTRTQTGQKEYETKHKDYASNQKQRSEWHAYFEVCIYVYINVCT